MTFLPPEMGMLLPVVAIVGLVLLVLLLTVRSDRQWRGRRAAITERLNCPVRGQTALVDFLLDLTNGRVYRDVTRCSLWRRPDVADCDKLCRSTTSPAFAGMALP